MPLSDNCNNGLVIKDRILGEGSLQTVGISPHKQHIQLIIVYIKINDKRKISPTPIIDVGDIFLVILAV